MAHLEDWSAPEWYDPQDGIYDAAESASDVRFLVECEVTHGEDGWMFLVKATNNFSEYPEVQDAGPCTSMDDGKARCERVTDGVVKRYLSHQRLT